MYITLTFWSKRELTAGIKESWGSELYCQYNLASGLVKQIKNKGKPQERDEFIPYHAVKVSVRQYQKAATYTHLQSCYKMNLLRSLREKKHHLKDDITYSLDTACKSVVPKIERFKRISIVI